MKYVAAIQKLRSEGERITPVRVALVDILLKSKTPRTIQELLLDLKKKGLKANKTTVYRQIEALIKYAVVSEVHFSDQTKRYEIIAEGGHHHHLVCLRCKMVEDVSFPSDLKEQEKLIAKKHRFKVLKHSLEFFGLCHNCQNKKTA